MSGANAGATPAALAGAYTGYLKDRSHMSLDERFLDSRVLSLLISSQFRAPGKGELLSTETNPDREWRQYNLVGRTKRFHYGLHDIYKSSCDETRTNGRSGMFHKALVAPAKVYKHLGLHHAIEVESADGSRKYWDADKGADGYLKPRSQLWSQRDMDHVVTRIPVCRANYTDAENDMIWSYAVHELDGLRGPYHLTKNNCRHTARVAREKMLNGEIDVLSTAEALRLESTARAINSPILPGSIT